MVWRKYIFLSFYLSTLDFFKADYMYKIHQHKSNLKMQEKWNNGTTEDVPLGTGDVPVCSSWHFLIHCSFEPCLYPLSLRKKTFIMIAPSIANFSFYCCMFVCVTTTNPRKAVSSMSLLEKCCTAFVRSYRPWRTTWSYCQSNLDVSSNPAMIYLTKQTLIAQ